MKILVIGKSAREHAFIEKISQSPRTEEIFCIPGNPAIAQFATCLNIALDDLTSITEFAKEKEIDLTIALDEYVIQNGITNIFQQEGLKIFAPTQEAAQIATSRAFAKKFLYKNKIATPKYGVFDKESSAIDYIKKSPYPLIVKYDHLAHQDSFLCNHFNRAKTILSEVFHDVQKKVIIEEFLEGDYITLSVLTDGYNVLPLPYVHEYKRVLDGEGGAITKGVGAYTPVGKITPEIESIIAQEIIFPLVDAMRDSGISYEGFLSASLLLQPDGKVNAIEFLPTLSIAEATCVLQLIEDDLLDIIYAASEGALEDVYENIYTSDDAVVSVGLLSGSYPTNPRLESIVEGIELIDDDESIELYYNDVGMNSYYEISTTGGRPFFLTARAATLNKARENVYENIDYIKYSGKNYRKDIAKFTISKEF